MVANIPFLKTGGQGVLVWDTNSWLDWLGLLWNGKAYLPVNLEIGLLVVLSPFHLSRMFR